jgi:flagellar basal body P-ring formation protein FlgA
MMRQLVRHEVGRYAIAAIAGLCGLLTCGTLAAAESSLYAVVPRMIIYPGQAINSDQLRRVEVTNPNLEGDYAQSMDEVAGKVTKKTLLPDHAIYVSALRDPFAVSRGTQVRLVFEAGSLSISALGIPLDDGGIGDLVRVRNVDSGLTISGIVTNSGTVRVVQK